MIVGWVGRAFRALSRLRTGEARWDLEHVGQELARLEQRRAQRPATSR